MKNTIQLQYVGRVNATPAGDIKVGTTLRWNFGATSKVVSIPRQTEKSIWITSISEEGNEHTRRFLKTRLVGTL
tara:strand:- start:4481 stop:4702 length:222 start_codon:yes stop_codon:yes gene_type:complete